eukprot:scaffold1453_cov112-Isochrysis_galbana.AAC.10
MSADACESSASSVSTVSMRGEHIELALPSSSMPHRSGGASASSSSFWLSPSSRYSSLATAAEPERPQPLARSSERCVERKHLRTARERCASSLQTHADHPCAFFSRAAGRTPVSCDTRAMAVSASRCESSYASRWARGSSSRMR